MSDPDFPPTTQVPYSVRKSQLEVAKFLAIRKAVSENENYRNPDGTQMMTYVQTLHNRNETKEKVLEFELAQGWLSDDRGEVPEAIQSVIQAPQIQQLPVPVVIIPTVVASVAQAIAVAQPTETQAPVDNSTSLPTNKLRRAKPNLGMGLAPPPITPVPTMQSTPQSPFPQPPPGATVIGTTQFVPSTSVPTPAPMVAQQVVETVVDLKPLIDKIDKLGKGLEQISGDQQSQRVDVGAIATNLSEINKSLTMLTKAVSDLNQRTNMMVTAMHHIYITSPGTAKVLEDANIKLPTSNDFQTYLQKYLPQ